MEDEDINNDRLNQVDIAPVLDPKNALYEYISNISKKKKLYESPEYRKSIREQELARLKDQSMMDLLKSGADLGASFANRRYIDPNSEIPVSGFNPDNTKKLLGSFNQPKKEPEVDPKVLNYLLTQKQKEDEAQRNRDWQEKMLGKKIEAGANAPLTPYQKESLDIQKQRNAIEAGKTSEEKRSFESLPADKQRIVIDLTAKNANKISIINQIGSFLDTFDTLTPDQQLSLSKGMIKVLNSSEGQDAVGAEEARRLAGKLEFALGNFTNDNPTQFGRDIEGFKKDAFIKHNSLVDAVNANQNEINKITGRNEGNLIQRKTEQKKESNEVYRLDPKTGKTAVFDKNTKQFLRYKD